jgi:TPR repeat protein
MKFATSAALFLLAVSACAQTLPSRPLELPKQDHATQPDQLAACRVQADKGDPNAIFQLGFFYLIGQGVAQDAATAEQYFKKVELSPAQKCFLAETYMETNVPTRKEAAMRWATAANSACIDWAEAGWYRGNQLGPNTQKEVELLRKGLELPHNDYRAASERRLGELLLTGTAIEATPSEKTAWVGEAARQRLGQEEGGVAWLYQQRPQDAESPDSGPEISLDWERKAARYGVPGPLSDLGQAAMTRQVSDLSYLDGMGLYALAARQDVLVSATLEMQIKQLDPAQQEDLENSVARWQRIHKETGGYYTNRDPLLLSAAVDEPKLIETELLRNATAKHPDAQLRLAYLYESKGQLAKAEALYREVWMNGPAQVWLPLAEDAATAGKWPWARQLYLRAANAGSRPACLALSRIEGDGLAGKKNAFDAYLWLLRAETNNAKQLAQRKNAVTDGELQNLPLMQARWIVDHQQFWTRDLRIAQSLVEADQQASVRVQGWTPVPEAPVIPVADLKRKADTGDVEAAYQLAVRLLWHNDDGVTIEGVEHYAKIGAKTPEQKAYIAEGYERLRLPQTAESRRLLEEWWLAVGGSRGPYELGVLYYGKSDGPVESDDEKKAVAYWQQAVVVGDERWARIARMKLGYSVIKGWSSGDRVHDAAWAHELAMEFLGREFYQVAGEYSYGRELQHNVLTYTRLAERAAIYNSDNGQSQLASAILDGTWKQQDEIDAYAWMKLHNVKQDTGDVKKLELAEENPDLRQKIAVRYALLLTTRADSGAFYPQDDSLRTATIEALEPRAAQLDPEAQFRLGTLLTLQGTPESLARAIRLYRTLWATSGAEVRLTLGRKLMTGWSEGAASGGWGLARDDVGAEKWLWDAANAGSHEACRDLAVIYKEGRGVPQDPVAAATWESLADPHAMPSVSLSAAQAQARDQRVADWLSKHPAWLTPNQ